MRKPGTDEDNVQMSDVLCDFCHAEWTEDVPVIEGHQGSIICGKCLTVAFTQVVLHAADTGRPGYKCVMCLEHREDVAWESPVYPEATICKRCINLAAGSMSKDPDTGWKRPTKS